jgi:hypothetical protein
MRLWKAACVAKYMPTEDVNLIYTKVILSGSKTEGAGWMDVNRNCDVSV